MSTHKQYNKKLSIILDNLPIKKVVELFDFVSQQLNVLINIQHTCCKFEI